MRDNKKKATEKGHAAPMYIVKPSDLCQGKGIFFATEIE
jgi:hypothetical protein